MNRVEVEPHNQMSIEALMTAWKQEAAERKRRIGRAFPVGMFIALAPLGALYVALALGRIAPPYPFLLLMSGISLVSTCLGMNRIDVAKRYTPRQQELAQTLLTIDDLRAVGPLIVALNAMTEIPKGQIVATLMRLLPRMQAGDASLLNAEQRQDLYSILPKHFDSGIQDDLWAEFRITILKALEQIGDSAAIPYVERLATALVAPAMYPSHRYQVGVRDAARACRPFLEQRVEQVEVGKNLLRASGDPAADNLLKPVMVAISTEPQQLLRAGAAPESQD